MRPRAALSETHTPIQSSQPTVKSPLSSMRFSSFRISAHPRAPISLSVNARGSAAGACFPFGAFAARAGFAGEGSRRSDAAAACAAMCYKNSASRSRSRLSICAILSVYCTERFTGGRYSGFPSSACGSASAKSAAAFPAAALGEFAALFASDAAVLAGAVLSAAAFSATDAPAPPPCRNAAGAPSLLWNVFPFQS